MHFTNNCVFGINELLIFKIFCFVCLFFSFNRDIILHFRCRKFSEPWIWSLWVGLRAFSPFRAKFVARTRVEKKDVNTPRGTIVKCTKSRRASLPEFLLRALTIIFFVFLFDLRNRFRRKKGLHSKNLSVVYPLIKWKSKAHF